MSVLVLPQIPDLHQALDYLEKWRQAINAMLPSILVDPVTMDVVVDPVTMEVMTDS
jgi:hypothetical protein